MKTKIKATLLLAALALTALAGCARDSGEFASKDYVFRSEELPVSQEFGNNGSTIITAGERLFLYGIVYNEDYTASKMVVVEIDKDGNALQRVEYPVVSNSYYGSVAASRDGRLYTVRTVYPVYDEPRDGGDIEVEPLPIAPREAPIENNDTDEQLDEAVDDDEDIAVTPLVAIDPVPRPRPGDGPETIAVDTEQYQLLELGLDGSERLLANLGENPVLNDQGYFYVNQIFCLPNNTMIISAVEKLAIYDMEGNFQSLLTIESQGEQQRWGHNFVGTADGRTIYYCYNEFGITFQTYDPASGAFGEAVTLNNLSAYGGMAIHPGVGYDLFINDDRILYGYNLGKEAVPIMNFLDSDLFISGLSNVVGLDATTFLATTYDQVENRQIVARFTKIPPSEIQDRIAIVFGGTYIDWNVKQQAVKFNKSNDKYRITLVEYGSIYNTNEDWRAGVTHLNTDIVSGRAPDIMQLSSDMPVKSYMAKGLFADLLPFIEKDAELDVNDLMPNVVASTSIGGKMYQLVPSYYVQTVFAKTSDVGPEPGWTLAEAKALLASKPPGTMLFDPFQNRLTVLQSALIYGGSQFVDWENARAHFDSPEFMEILELAKEYPEEIDYAMYEREGFWDDYESAYREGRVLLLVSGIDNMRTVNRIAKGQFGTEVTPIGFPTGSGKGAALSYGMQFAISAKSKNQEGAWEFLRYYLSAEYQESQTYQFPVSRKAHDKMAREATERPYWLDENGVKQEYDDYYFVNGQEFVLAPPTQAEVDKMTEYILSVTTAIDYNETLLNIITEEAAPYFAGQKSVNEVVTIIQSRAQIYVSENS
jgi:ABC-type glycerol-3-phosphate transport system substrate-binding protein